MDGRRDHRKPLQSDLFGRRTPAKVRKIRGQDRARTLLVKAPPRERRPPGFSGAVGRGFSLEVKADRIDVKTLSQYASQLAVTIGLASRIRRW